MLTVNKNTASGAQRKNKMKEIDPIEKQRIEMIREQLKEQAKRSREERLRDMVPPNAPPEMVISASRHLDMLDEAVQEEAKTEMFPTREEIEDFIITPESWQNALRYYHEHRSELIADAAEQLKNAVSHRSPPFQVGSVAVSIGPDLEMNPEYKKWKGYNLKLKPGEVKGAQKKCAERNALEEAEFYSKAVFALVTVSKESTTGDSAKGQGVLHPCMDCRVMFRDLLKQGFLKEDTIILNVNNSKDPVVTEERTLKELLELYNDDPV